MFLPHTRTSAQVLGLYGVGGLGKPSMSKCLCNHFNEQFSGSICYIEIKEEVKVLEQQRLVMRKLLRLGDLLLKIVCDVSEVKFLLVVVVIKLKVTLLRWSNHYAC